MRMMKYRWRSPASTASALILVGDSLGFAWQGLVP
jgi:hypothetical protein